MGNQQPSNLKSENGTVKSAGEASSPGGRNFLQRCERHIERRERSVERRERSMERREHSLERRERSFERREHSLDSRDSSVDRNERAINIPNETDCTSCDSTKILLDDFQSMLDNEYFPDIDIKCRSEDMRAHKCVLGARSSIFRAMFKSPMLETENNRVVIDDIDPAVFRAFLSFIYSGQTRELDTQKACALLHAAEKYQIETLKQKCANFLRESLTVENCLDVLQCAELYDQQLKVDVMAAIVKFFKALQPTRNWTDFQENNPGLSLRVYSHVVSELQVEKKTT